MNKTSTLPLFSFFNAPITNNIPTRNINLLQLYKAITSDYYAAITKTYRANNNHKEAVTLKTNRFDYVTFCGTFSKRNDSSLLMPSGYMVLDIDKQKNITSIKEQLIKDVELQPTLIFVSPSGNGLKVVVDIDIGLITNSTNNKKLINAWQAINSYLANFYNKLIIPDAKGNYIDPSGTDLSRACFICHDSECFINNKFLQ